MEHMFKISRAFLAWSQPGGDVVGQVELIPPDRLDATDPNLGRTAAEVTIPAGCVLRYKVKEEGALPRT